MIDISRIPATKPVRIIIGAGEQRWPGWIATHRETLDLLRPEDWAASFGRRLVDAFLCEHVWGAPDRGRGTGGRPDCATSGSNRAATCAARCPMPISRMRNTSASPGSAGPARKTTRAADHKIVYDRQRFADVFIQAGFAVDLLEYCDEQGRFHYHQWSPDQGPVYRSLRLDHRNREGKLGFVSLIIDAHKPA